MKENPTPDSLRQCPPIDYWTDHVARMNAHADAWEADKARIEALEKDLIGLWNVACCCGVVTEEDAKEWDRIQAVCAALAAGEERP
jgi:hypothetical protein